MKKRKNFYLRILTFIFFIGLFFVSSVKAEAASFKHCGRIAKIGSYYIWINRDANEIRISKSMSGNGRILVSAANGCHISDCLSDGSTVYYIESVSYQYGERTIDYVYTIKTNGDGKNYIGKLNNADSFFTYYDNCLYLIGGMAGCMPGNTYCLNVKTKRTKRILKDAVIWKQYKQYLLAWANSGVAEVDRALYVYNCKTGKIGCITKKGFGGEFFGKRIYYTEKYPGNLPYIRVCRCNLSGKNKRTLVKKVKGDYGWIGKVTAKYIYCDIGDKYYRYNIKTKKLVRISVSKFLKIVHI